LAEHSKFVGLLTPKQPDDRAPMSGQLADALARHRPKTFSLPSLNWNANLSSRKPDSTQATKP